MIIGRLNNKIAYLIGPIDRCPDLGTTWRAEMEEVLTREFGVNVYNPRNKPMSEEYNLETSEQIAKRKAWKKEEKFDQFSNEIKTIVCIDERMCQRCDFAICYIDTDIHMCGTYDEISVLNAGRKPVIVFCKQGKKGIPDWLFGRLPHDLFFENKEQVLAYLFHIHTSDKINDYGRWLFFER